jgi:hypothetical protein
MKVTISDSDISGFNVGGTQYDVTDGEAEIAPEHLDAVREAAATVGASVSEKPDKRRKAAPEA